MPPSKTRLAARKGFTLIELLVVVSIIGLLASIAAPNFLSAMDRARNAQVAGNVKAVQTALVSYASDHKGVLFDDYFNGVIPRRAKGNGKGSGKGKGGGGGGGGKGKGGGKGGKGGGGSSAESVQYTRLDGEDVDNFGAYLNGGTLPASPWADEYQSMLKAGLGIHGGAGCPTASEATQGTSLPQVGAVHTQHGTMPSSGIVRGNEFGVVLMDYDSDSSTYVLYGLGKRGKNAVIAAAVSNNGAR